MRGDTPIILHALLWVGSRRNFRSSWEGLSTPQEGSGSLSMMPVCCTPWCSTDALQLSTIFFALYSDDSVSLRPKFL